jgi:Zn-dependent M16 (insulinase) family peptidase
MTKVTDPNNQGLGIGDELFGYQVESITALDEINAVLYRLQHTATGAQHVHISTRDRENTFGVTFKTVPRDSTGVAHILEHTALCGSNKYPVRDPFFSMLKRSLSTFMNAFTASDWTMYPFSTQNTTDFYNLMDVYLDAAFFPKLDALSFKQEGHRLEVETADEQETLVYKGVVYNEMKGAMSSPDQVMTRSVLNALYPDTTYGFNSGGDPLVIPQLTYEQLKQFHGRHYHPSNAFFYTYGNLPLKDQLTFIADKIMSRFTRIDPNTDVPSQPRWDEPRKVEYTYPLSPSEAPDKKCQVCLAWLTCDIRDSFEVLVLTVLEQILLANAASPLRKALIDSGLGSALCDGSGFDADNRDTLFAAGLKDTAPESQPKVAKIIMDVMRQLVDKGIDKELIDSALHQIEFSRKEVTNTPYPYGLRLLLMMIGGWLHGGDPGKILSLDSDMQRLRSEIDQGPFLESRIRTYFIDNPHRISMILAPDQQKEQKEAEQIRQELNQRLRQLIPEQLQEIKQDAALLKRQQESQEDVSCLPTLALTDVPGDVPAYAPTKVTPDLPMWCYEQPTSGIFYLNTSASAALDSDLLPWVPFFCYAFTKSGTRERDYVELARKIDAVTGGLTLSPNARVPFGQSAEALPLVSLNAKCLARNIEHMVSIVEELIGQVDFSNHQRLIQLLSEYQAGLEAMVVHNGHRLAISLSSRTFSSGSALSEIWSGVHQIGTIRAFATDYDATQIETLSNKLAAIAKAIFQPSNVAMAAIGESQQVDQAIAEIQNCPTLGSFERAADIPKLATMEMPIDPSEIYEGWSTSTAVAFVAQTIPTVPIQHEHAPALAVLGKMLRSLYLHREIREKGGAYGGFALYNSENGLFSMASYRDPHIARTLDVFSGVLDFVRSGSITAEDVKEAILQVCSDIDRPDPPGPAARKAFSRRILGLTDETRLAFKKKLLQLAPKQVETIAETYFSTDPSRTGVAVIAGEQQLEQANEQLADKPLARHTI